MGADLRRDPVPYFEPWQLQERGELPAAGMEAGVVAAGH